MRWQRPAPGRAAPVTAAPFFAVSQGRSDVADARHIRTSCSASCPTGSRYSFGSAAVAQKLQRSVLRPVNGEPAGRTSSKDGGESFSSASFLAAPARKRGGGEGHRPGSPPLALQANSAASAALAVASAALAASRPSLAATTTTTGFGKAAGTGAVDDLGRPDGYFECAAASGGTGEEESCAPQDAPNRALRRLVPAGFCELNQSADASAPAKSRRRLPVSSVQPSIDMGDPCPSASSSAVVQKDTAPADTAHLEASDSVAGVAQVERRRTASVDVGAQTEPWMLPQPSSVQRGSSKESLRSPHSCLSGTSLDPRTWPMIDSVQLGQCDISRSQTDDLEASSRRLTPSRGEQENDDDTSPDLNEVRVLCLDTPSVSVDGGDKQTKFLLDLISAVRNQRHDLQQLCRDVRNAAVHQGTVLQDDATAGRLAAKHQQFEDCLSAALPVASSEEGVLAVRLKAFALLREQNQSLADQLVSMQRRQDEAVVAAIERPSRGESPAPAEAPGHDTGYVPVQPLQQTPVPSALGHSQSEKAVRQMPQLSACHADQHAGPLLPVRECLASAQSRSSSPHPIPVGGSVAVMPPSRAPPVVVYKGAVPSRAGSMPSLAQMSNARMTSVKGDAGSASPILHLRSTLRSTTPIIALRKSIGHPASSSVLLQPARPAVNCGTTSPPVPTAPLGAQPPSAPPRVIMEVPHWQRARRSSPPRARPPLHTMSAASSAAAPAGFSSTSAATANVTSIRPSSVDRRSATEVVYRPARRYRMRWVLEAEECFVADSVAPALACSPAVPAVAPMETLTRAPYCVTQQPTLRAAW